MTDKENNKPSITIDGVQIYVDELSEEAQGIFGRLQRLIQKKATLTLDLEEIQAGINFFSSTSEAWRKTVLNKRSKAHEDRIYRLT